MAVVDITMVRSGAADKAMALVPQAGTPVTLACGLVQERSGKEKRRTTGGGTLVLALKKATLGHVCITSLSLPPEKRAEGQVQFVVSQYFTLSSL